MNYENLPKALRARVDAQEGTQTRTCSRAVATEGTTTRWRCTACGEEFTSEAACERHPHLRVECVLLPATGAR